MAQILTIIKISRGIISTNLTNIVNESRVVNVRNTRNPNIFNTAHINLPKGGPLHRAATLVNQYRHLFHFHDSIPVIKRKLKESFFGGNQ